MKGLSCWADFAAKNGVAVPAEVYSFLHAGTFATLTNGVHLAPPNLVVHV